MKAQVCNLYGIKKKRLALDRPNEDLCKEAAEFFKIVHSLEHECSRDTMNPLMQGGNGLPQFDVFMEPVQFLTTWIHVYGNVRSAIIASKICVVKLAPTLKLHFACFGMAITTKHLHFAESSVKRLIYSVFSTLMDKNWRSGVYLWRDSITPKSSRLRSVNV